MSWIRHPGYFLTVIKMTEETTTPASEGSESAEANQAAAFKRLQEKNAELEAKVKSTESATPPTPEKEPEVGSPEYIQKLIQHTTKRETAVAEFLSEYPDLAVHKAEIEKRLNDPSRAKVPVDEIIRGAVPLADMLKIGAALAAKQAADEKNGQMGGGDGEAAKAKTPEQARAAKFNASLPKGFKPKT